MKETYLFVSTYFKKERKKNLEKRNQSVFFLAISNLIRLQHQIQCPHPWLPPLKHGW